MLSDSYCTLDNLVEIWNKVAGDLKLPVDFAKFVEVNRFLDQLVAEQDEGDDDEDDDDGEEENIHNNNDNSRGGKDLERSKLVISDAGISEQIDSLDPSIDAGSEDIVESGVVIFDQEEGGGSGQDDESRDLIDVWDPTFDANTAFEPDFLVYLRDYFQSYCNDQGLLSYEVFAQWDDVIQMMKAGQVGLITIHDIRNVNEIRNVCRLYGNNLSIIEFIIFFY